MKLRAIILLASVSSLFLANLQTSEAQANKYDIGSGGQATISSTAYGGTVTSNASLSANLVVNVDFGELSPINRDGIVKVVVPIAIRSTDDYRVTLAVTGTVGTDPNAVQLSDIGFGIQNLRSLGARATACGGNSVINSLFNNDPSTSVTIGSASRATFPSALSDVGPSTVLINGPTLSVFRSIGEWKRETNNGWAFDAILAIVPQWFSVGNFSLTLTFTISQGPSFPC